MFISACTIQVLVNKRFHRVDVKDVLRDFVKRVGESFHGEWLVELSKLRDIKEFLPLTSVNGFNGHQFRLFIPFLTFNLNLLELSLNQLVPYLF